MPDIRYPDGAGTPFVPGQPAPPRRADERRDTAEENSASEESPWQSTVVRVSTMIAVLLGY